MIGQVSHFRILEKIGEGGMGEVYRAHDERLHRDVAIKVLPEAVAQDEVRLARFEREARAVATLSHPNILDIYDFGREGDITYAVTELLEGETLRERLEGGTLGWRRATEIGAAAADGLAAAHQAGIVHRDLKPSNVFLTSDGRVKVLDFGLARYEPVGKDDSASRAPTVTRHTDPGTVLGTVGYMSPEQVRGADVDHRSDIFSLGCVLYEMVSGRRTFARDTAVETMNAILKEEPEDISASGVALPPELAGTVRRCLEKRPQSRYQSASDLAYTLRTISSASASSVTRPVIRTGGWRRAAPWVAIGGAMVAALVLATVLRGPLFERGPPALPEVSPKRVAIVPLENRTGDPSLDALGVMAADLIVRRFTETAAAEVVPLADAMEDASSAGLEGAQTPGWADVLQLARQRGAGLVLSGAYYLEGDTLRLQARLADAAAGDLIYAFEPMTVAREAAADGIDSLRERVVAAVATHVFIVDIDIAVMRPPSSYEAFQAFQRGLESFGTNWPEALAHFQRALELDPEFHYARFQVVWVHFNVFDDDGVARELSALEERLDRMTPYEKAHVRHQRSLWEWDRSASVDAVRRMLELCPKDQGWRLDLGMRALELNRPMEAVNILDPLLHFDSYGRENIDWWLFTLMAAARHMLGDYQRELDHATGDLERIPGMAPLFHAKARALAALGQTEAVDELIDEFLRIQTRAGSAGWLMSATALELRAHGHREAADEMAARAVTWYEGHPSVLLEKSGTQVIEMWIFYPVERNYFANALWMVGRWRDLEDLIGGLIETEPSEHQLAGWLGVIAAIRGDNEKARRISDGLTAGDSPRAQGWGTYWQASIAAHLGEKDRAVELLAEAFSKGYPYGVTLHSTLDFEPLWDYPPFQELIKPKG